MNNLVGITLIALTLSCGFSQLSLAVCVEGPANTFTCNTNPPNPDTFGVQQLGNPNNLTVNVLPGAEINTEGQIPNDGIQTGDGSDNVSVNGGVVTGDDVGIVTQDSADTITVINSVVSGLNDSAIRSGNGQDNITVIDSVLNSFDSDGISTGADNDTVYVESTTIISPGENSIFLQSGDDTLTLGSRVELDDLISCGLGFDTVIFAMELPRDQISTVRLQILQAETPDGSITIDGLFYEWINCENLVPDLKPIIVEGSIPTLSQWGMIAMAGVLGIAGFMVMRRRKATA